MKQIIIAYDFNKTGGNSATQDRLIFVMSG
jgi:hypothetical protein